MRFLLGLLRSAWHGLDIFRRVLHLVFLLLLLFIGWAAVRGSVPRLPERGALVLRPSGQIVEQLAGEPLERALNEAQGQGSPETLLWDMTRAIRSAAQDSRVGALLIVTDDLEGAGQAKLEELGRAIADFRKSGKKVIARGSSFLQPQYYLASLADEVYLDPTGFVVLDGYARFRMYYKGALDKLGVDVHLIRAGRFKSAEEPFIRQDMSADDRVAATAYLQALWRGYRESVGKARALDPDLLDRYANGLAAAVRGAGGDTAAVALKAGLVTGLKTGAEVDARMRELVGSDDDDSGFRAIDLGDYLHAPRVAAAEHGSGDAVGVVLASGEIQDGRQPPGTVGGDSTSELLRRARNDEHVRAVVLRIDSPGGSVYASEQIYREVQALRAAGKPVVASFGDLAASGGYYIASGADAIVASPNTLTGSIGVFAAIPTFDRTLAKLGVTVDGVGTTALSGAMRLDRPLTPEAEQALQAVINHTYGDFLGHVADGRKKTVEQVDEIAQGRVWVGSEALKIGLVDSLGGYGDAIRLAAGKAHLKEGYAIRHIEPELSVTQQLLVGMRGATHGLMSTLGWAGPPHAALRAVAPPSVGQRLDAELARWQRFAGPTRAWAYCFCEAD
jgi:protease-4